MRAISSTEWNDILSRAGVNEVCWSMITGRCGSTLLASLTRESRFGNGGEPLNDLAGGKVSESLPEFLERTARERSVNGRWYFQINWPRYSKLRDAMPVFEQTPSVILRRNIFAQALSFWNAQTSGIWHNHAGRLNQRESVRPSLDPAGYVYHIARQEKAIAERFPASRIFYYEDIVAAPAEALLALSSFHGAVIPVEKIERATAGEMTNKIVRSGYMTQYLDLINQFDPEIVAARLSGVGPIGLGTAATTAIGNRA